MFKLSCCSHKMDFRGINNVLFVIRSKLPIINTSLNFQEIASYKLRVKNASSQGGLPAKSKKTVQFYKPSIECLQEDYYLIASDIFSLAGSCRKLTREEIDSLPILVSWKGVDFRYHTSKEKCFRLLTLIIFDVNLCQNKRFVSFPLGSTFVATTSRYIFV